MLETFLGEIIDYSRRTDELTMTSLLLYVALRNSSDNCSNQTGGSEGPALYSSTFTTDSGLTARFETHKVLGERKLDVGICRSSTLLARTASLRVGELT